MSELIDIKKKKIHVETEKVRNVFKHDHLWATRRSINTG